MLACIMPDSKEILLDEGRKLLWKDCYYWV